MISTESSFALLGVVFKHFVVHQAGRLYRTDLLVCCNILPQEGLFLIMKVEFPTL